MANSAPLWLLDDGRIMGGGQRFALRLARFAHVRLLCPASSALHAIARDEGIAVTAVEFPDPHPRAALAWPGAVRRLRAALAPAPPDAVLVGNSARTQALLALARPRPWPVVHLMHEQESAARASARFVHRRVGRVVAVGANAAATYSRALGADVGRVNNFLLDDEWASLAAVRDAPRPGGPVLGVIGRMIPEKGIEEAVAEVAAVAGARLLVAAPRQDEAYAARVETRAAPLGDRVELLGAVDDLAGFLAGIDVLLVPSVGHEGQPTAILEALGAGLPVVVRRPIWSADYEGLPVTPYDDDLAPALASLGAPAPLDELRRRFGPEQAVAVLQTV